MARLGKSGAEAPAQPPAEGAKTLRPLRVTGESSVRPKARKVLPEDECAGAVLIFRPGAYEVFGDRVLPRLHLQVLEDGQGGVRRLRDGRFDLSGLRDNEEAGGNMLLPLSWGYVGEGSGDPVSLNGSAFVPCEFAWRTPAEYHALVASWVDDGRLPAAGREDLEALLEAKSKTAGLVRVQQKEPVQHGIDEIERQIAIVRAALAALEEGS